MGKRIISFTLFFLVGISFFNTIEAKINNEKNKAGLSKSIFSGLKYRCIGPSRGGRVTAVEGVAAEPSTFYMGATGGGVWKTTDYGQSWKNISDGYFETGSIGDIQVADSDPNIIYVGTGSDGIRSNVIKGLGVYKSTDAGKTWKFVGLRNVGQIGAVEVHPTNPDIVFVAALGQAFGPNSERGVFRSKDGGKNWEKVLFLSDTTGAADLEFSPDNPNEIYVSMWRAERKPWTIISGGLEGGVYKSTDGGDTWKKLGGGLPTGIIGKNDLAVSAADSNRLYVLYEALHGAGLYCSKDRGENFELISTQRNLLDRPFYYCNLDADPTNADVLYVNSTGFYKSIDGGKSWQRRSTPHGDNHDMWINPNDPNLFIQSNDGGANVTRDGGKTWSSQQNQPTAELYQVNVDDQFLYWVYAGQQDNSTIMLPSLPPYSPAIGPSAFWQAIGGCETGPAVPKPGNHNIVYANCKGRFGRYNKLTGQEKQYYVGAGNMYGHNPKDLKYRFQRVSPIHVSPHDPNIVYHASQYLHKTTDEGVTWETISPDLTAFEPETQVISGSPITRDITGEEFYSTIYAIQESPIQQGLIWVGANDGPVHVTSDGGKTWKNVTPKDMPKGGRIQTVEPSPNQAGKAYFAAYRYLLGDWQPYIYRTNDYGKTWKRLTTGENGIPEDYPTRVVREDPDREGLLYAGTEFGMFISFDDGENWQKFQLNLPVTPVTDIKVYQKDLVLSTMGRSFWILDNVTPLHQMSDKIANSNYHIFQPKNAYRLRYRASREPEYPSPGASIDYFIGEEPKDKIKLEILNSEGKIIRTFESRNRPQRTNQEQQGMRGPMMRGLSRANLEKSKGTHRFNWDMRHEGPASARTGRRRGSGPMVSPGIYHAKLTIEDWSKTVNFNVLVDPRVAEDGVTQADLEEQEKISLLVRDFLSNARKAEDQIKKARKELKEKVDNSDKNAIKKDEQLKNLEAKFATNNAIRYPKPMLVDQISYLNSMLNRADQKPGQDAYIRFEELSKLLDEYVAKLEKILK